MIKSGFLGEVARYYADDYILWKYLPRDPERIFKAAKSETDLLVQRYIFLQKDGTSSAKKKSFLFGFRGFVEIHMYTLGDRPDKEIKDIAFLSNAAQKATEVM